jgi:hypothetical protein
MIKTEKLHKILHFAIYLRFYYTVAVPNITPNIRGKPVVTTQTYLYEEETMRKRWYFALSLLTMLALLLSACGTPQMPAAAEPTQAPAAADQPAAAPAEGAAQSEGLKEVPRNRTLIMAGLGGEHPGGFTDIELFNSYAPGLSRSGFTQACSITT